MSKKDQVLESIKDIAKKNNYKIVFNLDELPPKPIEPVDQDDDDEEDEDEDDQD